MTAKYLPTNQLQELPQMEEPRPPFGGIFSDYWEIHKKKMLAYKKEVAACRTLNCHEDCKRLWEEGDVLEEGKDYEVKKFCEHADNCLLSVACIACNDKAFPLVPVKSEDEFEREAILWWREHYGKEVPYSFLEWIHNTYSLTKR